MVDQKLTPVDELCMTLTKMESNYAPSLPPQIPSAKFIRVAVTAIRNNPKLAQCDRSSLFSAIASAAQQGLLVDGRESAIIPYGTIAKFMPMVAGICKKSRNSGEIKSLGAQIVYKKDTFEHWIDEAGEHFKHTPSYGDRGEILLTYAVAMTKDEGVYLEVIDEKDMLAIKNMSKAGDSPWKGPFENEMRKKSALRRLLKYRVPASTDIEKLVTSEDDIYDLSQKPAPAKPTSSRLRDIVDTTSETEPETEAPPVDGEDVPL